MICARCNQGQNVIALLIHFRRSLYEMLTQLSLYHDVVESKMKFDAFMHPRCHLHG